MDSIVKKLTDEELEKAFFEFKELRESGILPSGIIRQCIAEFKSKYPSDMSITNMGNEILYEIALRKYIVN